MASTTSAGPRQGFVRALADALRRVAGARPARCAELGWPLALILLAAPHSLILADLADRNGVASGFRLASFDVGSQLLIEAAAVAGAIALTLLLRRNARPLPGLERSAGPTEFEPAPAPASTTATARASVLSERAISDLMLRVSHEIRTPLNAVIGFSDMMQHQLLGPLGHSRYLEYVGHIRDSGSVLLKAAEDTLAMTSLVANPALADGQRVVLADVAEDVAVRLQPRASAAGKVIEVDIDRAIEVRADLRALRQTLLNLLCCGLDRTTSGRRLTVAAREQGAAVRIVVEAEAAGSEPDCGELALCLARTLVELQGLVLTERCGQGGWQGLLELEAVTQHEFFPVLSHGRH